MKLGVSSQPGLQFGEDLLEFGLKAEQLGRVRGSRRETAGVRYGKKAADNLGGMVGKRLAAFLRLRRREPQLPRPYVVPGGRSGALVVVALPAACALLAMATAGVLNAAVAIAAALTGPIAYVAFSGSRR